MPTAKYGSKVLNGADLPEQFFAPDYPEINTAFLNEANDSTTGRCYWGHFVVGKNGIYQRVKAGEALYQGCVVALGGPGAAGIPLCSTVAASVASTGAATAGPTNTIWTAQTGVAANDNKGYLLMVESSAAEQRGVIRDVNSNAATASSKTAHNVSQPLWNTTVMGDDNNTLAAYPTTSTPCATQYPLWNPVVYKCVGVAAGSETGLINTAYGVVIAPPTLPTTNTIGTTATVTSGYYTWIQVFGYGLVCLDGLVGTSGAATVCGANIIVNNGSSCVAGQCTGGGSITMGVLHNIVGKCVGTANANTAKALVECYIQPAGMPMIA